MNRRAIVVLAVAALMPLGLIGPGACAAGKLEETLIQMPWGTDVNWECGERLELAGFSLTPAIFGYGDGLQEVAFVSAESEAVCDWISKHYVLLWEWEPDSGSFSGQPVPLYWWAQDTRTLILQAYAETGTILLMMDYKQWYNRRAEAVKLLTDSFEDPGSWVANWVREAK